MKKIKLDRGLVEELWLRLIDDSLVLCDKIRDTSNEKDIYSYLAKAKILDEKIHVLEETLGLGKVKVDISEDEKLLAQS